jgi:hypothetical protein
MIHKGGCHCGKIAYECEGEVGAVLDCNSWLCRKRGGRLQFVPDSAFALKTPRQGLGTYRFNKHAIDHYFCPVRGVQSFTEGADAKGNKMVAINMRCVEGTDPRRLDVKFHNGRDH